MEAGSGRSDEGGYDKAESDSESESDGGVEEETRALNGGSGSGRPRSYSRGSQRRVMRTGSRLTEEQQKQKELLQVMLLEAGILFHSVFIGISHLYSLFGPLRVIVT